MHASAQAPQSFYGPSALIGKITGILLELPTEEALKLVQNPDALREAADSARNSLTVASEHH